MCATRIPTVLLAISCLLTPAAGASPQDHATGASDGSSGAPGRSSRGVISVPVEAEPVFRPVVRRPPQPIDRDFDVDVEPGGTRPEHQEDASAVLGSVEAPALLRDFEGQEDNWIYIPPDPILAAGPAHLVQAVNNEIRISTKDGTTLATVPMATWWAGVATPDLIFDPWLHYDHHDDRWVLIATGYTPCTPPYYYLMSTSFGSDPTGPWVSWALRADVDGTTFTGLWADYPKVGLDDTNFYVTSNQYPCGSAGSPYAKIRVMAKSQFYANTGGSIDWWDFSGLPTTVQPCLTFGVPGKEWLVRAPYSGGSSVQAWTITGTWPGASPPVLTDEGTFPVGSYTDVWPPVAQQPGGEPALHVGDARLLGAVYRNGSIWTCHTVGGAPDPRCRYLQLDVETMSAVFDVTYGATGFAYFYPAINVDPTGTMFTVFSRLSQSVGEFAGARFTQKRGHESFLQVSAALKSGEASYYKIYTFDSRNRWGDYGAVAIDPVNTTHAWLTHEYAKPPGTTIPPFIGDGTWSTWIGEVGQPPVNDSCFSSIIIQEGTYYGTLNGATNDGDASCGFTVGNADVWYVWTAPASGLVKVSTCGSRDMNGADTGTDTVLSVHSLCPGTLANELACNDDDPSCAATGGDPLDSALSLSVTAGQFFLIRVSHYEDSPAQDFQLHLDLIPVPEVYCTAKTSSAGCVTAIAALDPGAPPASGAADYFVTASQVQELKIGLLFAGIFGRANSPFNGGTLCAQPPLKRGPTMFSGGATPTGCGGTFSTLINDGNVVPDGLDAGAGNTGWYQYWYRDPDNGQGTLGTALSNAVEIAFS